jgi:hypothetical protein
MKLRWIALMLPVLLSACGKSDKSDPFADCKYSRPEAIFSQNLPGVSRHSFEIAEGSAIEKLQLDKGIRLTVLQSGCEEVRQEFRFEMPGKYQERGPDFWIDQSIMQLDKLADLGPEYFIFEAWARGVFEKNDQISLGRNTEIQPGFDIRIDRELHSDHAILVLTLSGQP